MGYLLQILLVSAALAATVSANIHGNLKEARGKTVYTGCKIKNKQYDKHLYTAGAYFQYDGKAKRTFLWTPGNDIQENNWSLESYDHGLTWHIKNTHFDEYLHNFEGNWNTYAKEDSERRRVATYKVRKEDLTKPGTWKLDSEDDGQCVTIYNLKNQEYLYADGAKTWDHERRRVFTWISGKPGGIQWEESKWKINCE